MVDDVVNIFPMLDPTYLVKGVKKPAGTADEIEKQFGCESSRLIMIHFGSFNFSNGFLTILTAPLSCAEEPLIVQQTTNGKTLKKFE
ncbi:phosphatidylglycerophosphate phosphatase 1, chloroplastic/mitochondrial-like [Capsicum annuum]|uniref:phosphatidylglycerophosphate phosphatase 1, chloroplastic/mitochondrial-like n=1 Tax=Capsicum annuum TaxID=4072 RepID=UPI001FB102B0|nr:phosphatidylglycerophosphate phosphatase 1, chloroplastic/mitochondrial-like [Capsicum annuum]